VSAASADDVKDVPAAAITMVAASALR